MELLEQIETQSLKIEQLRAKLPVIEKIPLSAGLEGYNTSKVFGIYKKEGEIV
jgi:hypothetical protein